MSSRSLSTSTQTNFFRIPIIILFQSSMCWLSQMIPPLVMPLMHPCADTKWETVGQVVGLIKQVFEVCSFPPGVTAYLKYYYIDFGMSIRYNPEDGPPREHPMVGGDKSVPEFRNWTGELLDPFLTDIYYIGCLN
ncbi:hypothetical protein C8Q74DRAFT_1259355 [Fomes fomentarius]|nr:hypothetical protein C8Q74DRAFT_1259355 [Fomes fomentarius]